MLNRYYFISCSLCFSSTHPPPNSLSTETSRCCCVSKPQEFVSVSQEDNLMKPANIEECP